MTILPGDDACTYCMGDTFEHLPGCLVWSAILRDVATEGPWLGGYVDADGDLWVIADFCDAFAEV